MSCDDDIRQRKLKSLSGNFLSSCGGHNEMNASLVRNLTHLEFFVVFPKFHQKKITYKKFKLKYDDEKEFFIRLPLAHHENELKIIPFALTL